VAKRPTQAAWRKILLAFEAEVFNPAFPHLTEVENIALLAVHDVLRLRASGAGSTTPQNRAETDASLPSV